MELQASTFRKNDHGRQHCRGQWKEKQFQIDFLLSSASAIAHRSPLI
jgi:hypothetical protein